MALSRTNGIFSPQRPQVPYSPVCIRRSDSSISAKFRTSRSMFATAIPAKELRSAIPTSSSGSGSMTISLRRSSTRLFNSSRLRKSSSRKCSYSLFFFCLGMAIAFLFWLPACISRFWAALRIKTLHTTQSHPEIYGDEKKESCSYAKTDEHTNQMSPLDSNYRYFLDGALLVITDGCIVVAGLQTGAFSTASLRFVLRGVCEENDLPKSRSVTPQLCCS
jgi:hypothetical protein